MTTELLDMINVIELCVTLEPKQDALLAEILAGDLITVTRLDAQNLRARKSAASKPPKVNSTRSLW